MSDLVGNPEDRFYHDEAHITEQNRILCIFYSDFCQKRLVCRIWLFIPIISCQPNYLHGKCIVVTFDGKMLQTKTDYPEQLNNYYIFSFNFYCDT